MKRVLFYIGLLLSLAAAANMLFQLYIASDELITQDDLKRQESISSLFLILGVYLVITFRRKNKIPF